jgi:hypothetical protein
MTGPHPARDAWTADDDRTLMAMFAAKTPVAVIARKLKRSVGAIQSRRSKLRRPARLRQQSGYGRGTEPNELNFTRRASPVRDGGRRGDAGAD